MRAYNVAWCKEAVTLEDLQYDAEGLYTVIPKGAVLYKYPSFMNFANRYFYATEDQKVLALPVVEVETYTDAFKVKTGCHIGDTTIYEELDNNGLNKN